MGMTFIDTMISGIQIKEISCQGSIADATMLVAHHFFEFFFSGLFNRDTKSRQLVKYPVLGR